MDRVVVIVTAAGFAEERRSDVGVGVAILEVVVLMERFSMEVAARRIMVLLLLDS